MCVCVCVKAACVCAAVFGDECNLTIMCECMCSRFSDQQEEKGETNRRPGGREKIQIKRKLAFSEDYNFWC